MNLCCTVECTEIVRRGGVVKTGMKWGVFGAGGAEFSMCFQVGRTWMERGVLGVGFDVVKRI